MRQWCHVAVVLTAVAAHAGEPAPADPARRLRITVAGFDKPDGGATTDVPLDKLDGVWARTAPVKLPFATVEKVVVEAGMPGSGQADIRVYFQATGEPDADRRFLCEVWTSDAEGRVLWHTWELQPDARFNRPRRIGSRIGTPSLVNHATFRIPASAAPRLRAVKVQLRAMAPAEWRHYPTTPTPIGLAMTRPDKDGRFEVRFARPEGDPGPRRKEDLARQRVSVTLSSPDAAGKPGRREFRSAEPQADGRYRVAFQLDPKLTDKAEVAVAFYEAQPDQKDFGQKFFVEGRGTTYSGSWLSLRRPLNEVPFAD